MIENKLSDADWMEWVQAMRRIADLMREENFNGALGEVELFLSRERVPQLHSDALGFRAEIKERLGNLEGSERDWLTARSLIGASYGRYAIELSLGRLSENQGQREEATDWYRTALKTCLEGEGFSGGTALQNFLRLRPPETLSPEERTLCIEAVRHSWEVHGLPGQPNFADFARVVSAIKQAETNPPKAPEAS